ncbi:MAG: DUF86 domain-containing protein [Phycisphaerales bacterium]|nr:DUF86 domain-containing protein [Phycisphaerales bacterium]
MAPDDLDRLRHIRDAGLQAMNAVAGKRRGDLDRDALLGHAIVRLLEIVGEASNGISVPLRLAYPDIPWVKMIAMRHRLIHGYFDVNMELVWRALTDELPPIMKRMETVIAEIERDPKSNFRADGP